MPVWPVDGLNWGQTTWVSSIGESIGGNGANTAFALATLGVPVRLAGAVGRDPQGQTLLTKLNRAGVETKDVSSIDLPTTRSVCLVNSTGDRLLLHQPGSSAGVTIQSACRLWDHPSAHSHFHLANPFGLPNLRNDAGQVMWEARRNGKTTSLDAGWDPKGRWLPDLSSALPHTDLFFLNQSEAFQLTGTQDPPAAARVLRDAGALNIVFKRGGDGCTVCLPDTEFDTPAFEVRARDTTGAGDCFVAGFLAALHHGLDWLECARIANAVAAMKVEQTGAVSGLLPWEQTIAWAGRCSVR